MGAATRSAAAFVLAVAGLCALAGASVDHAAAGTATLVFAPEADARVHEASPTRNYATSYLRAEGGRGLDRESYLRFSVSGLSGSVQSAELRLYVYESSRNGPAVYSTSNAWSEGSITWRNRPARTSDPRDDKGAIANNSWVAWDVTPFVTGEGTYSFILATNSGDGISMRSREASSLRPELVVEVGAAEAPLPGEDPPPAEDPSPPAEDPSPPAEDPPPPAEDPPPPAEDPPPPQEDPVIAAAGDIASCSYNADEATAKLLDSLSPTRVLTLGDNGYESGTDAEFSKCYHPTWGRHKAKTSPSVGNHEYETARASGYFNYFGAAAGEPSKGYYAFDLGAWRLYALNSNCVKVSCAAGSAQEQWLRADLAAQPRSCTLAYMHHPRFASGTTSGRRNNTSVAPLYRAFYEAAGDVWLVGHNHYYERLAPLAADGTVDRDAGVRNFVVGTGGRGLHQFGTPIAGSEVRNNSAHGVLKLMLAPTGYEWKFVPEAGKSFTDSGSGSCSEGT